MKPGDIVKLKLSHIVTHMRFENEAGTDLMWDGISKIRSEDIMLYLGEEINRFMMMARIYHPRYNKVGYVRLDHIAEVL